MCQSNDLDRMMMACLTSSAIGLLPLPLPLQDDTDADHAADVATRFSVASLAAGLLALFPARR